MTLDCYPSSLAQNGKKLQAFLHGSGSSGLGKERQWAPTVNTRSKAGAGDSTVAGMVFALCEAKSIFGAVRCGAAAGAAAVMSEGIELCRRRDEKRR